MRTDRIADELAQLEAPDLAEAGERTWALVDAAFAARERIPRTRAGRRAHPLALATISIVATLALIALTPPGRAAADWIRERVSRPTVREQPPQADPSAPLRLPSGRLLVTAPSGTWVIQADGRKRRLGNYQGAAWSPNGLFVVAWNERTMTTIEPGSGQTRWTLTAPAPIREAAWAGPDGVYIAYTAGRQLHLVEGDGDNDHTVDRAVSTALAWRPGHHQLAYLDTSGRLHLYEPDSRRNQVLGELPRDTHTIAWSGDATTLLVASPRQLVLVAPDGRELTRRRVASATITAASIGQNRRSAAYATLAADGTSSVHQLTDPAPRFQGAGRLTDLHHSPDGRWLITSWPDTDQWLLIATRNRRRIQALPQVSSALASPDNGPAAAIDAWGPGAG